ncbi:MAG: hypothetical protein R8K20_07950, partial [Gallionellaceae bacterium]
MMSENTKFVYTYITAFIISAAAVLIDFARAGWHFGLENINSSTIILSLALFSFIIINQITFDSINSLFKKVENFPKEINTATETFVERLKKDIDTFKQNLSRGRVEHDHKNYRALIYEPDKGAIINSFEDEKDQSRNVLFSSTTINS